MIRVRDSNNTQQAISGIRVRDANNTLQIVTSIRVRDANNTLQTVYASARASASPNFVSGTGASGNPIAVQTKATTVTAAGASSFVWSQTSGDSSWSAVSPTSATTAFRRTGVGANEDYTATFACTATFPGGSTATASVTARVRNNGRIGGSLQ